MRHLSAKLFPACILAILLSVSSCYDLKAQYANTADSLALVDIYNENHTKDNSLGFTYWLEKPFLVHYWNGVTLDKNGYVIGLSVRLVKFSAAIGRLTHLQIAQLGAVDSIPSFMGTLTNLTSLTITACTGPIPAALGNLTKLNHLIISNTLASGSIPSSLGNLTLLTCLDLSQNKLTGTIPNEIVNLIQLDTFDISQNQLTGGLPPSIGNLTHLQKFTAFLNSLSGPLPESLGNCTSLTYLDFYGNQFTGSIPASIGNCTGLTNFYFFSNQLTGGIPASIGNLSKLYEIIGDYNQLTAPLPSSISKLTRLRQFSVRYNQITGPLPDSIGNMSALELLFLDNNQITGPLPSSIGNLTKLTQLTFGINKMSGSIPSSIGNLINLSSLDFSNNLFSGPIPATLGNLTKLSVLNLTSTIGGGQFTDTLPATLGNLVNLTGLSIANNKLTGKIPAILGNLTNLTTLLLNNNGLTGAIPASIGNLGKVTYLNLQKNQLSDSIPPTLGNLFSLTWFGAGYNQLTGKIPSSLGRLLKLGTLDLSYNQLSGPIPATFDSLVNLTDLWLHYNKLSGRVPPLGHLTKMINMELVGNQFTFNGMEELAAAFRLVASYNSQAPIKIIQAKDTLKVSAGGSLSNNTYVWNKVGGTGAIIAGDSTFVPPSAGKYFAYVQNKVAGMLTLYSDTINYSPELLVKIYDPGTSLARTNGYLNPNLSSLDLTQVIEGAATDGVTKVILMGSSGKSLRFTLQDGAPGSLTPLNLQRLALRDTIIDPTNDKVGIIYNVPDGYGNSAPPSGMDVKIKVAYADDPASAVDVSIHLTPPPVILVHGMWSKPAAWKKFKTYLIGAGFDEKAIFLADYSAHANVTFNPDKAESRYGREAVQAQIKAAMDYFHQRHLAITQVDIVAHSLGGLMTRSLSQQPDFLTAANYAKGSIHKLITLGTPHRGSPLGPELWKNQANLITFFQGYSTVADILKKAEMPIGTCHLDFGVNSPGIQALKQTPLFKSYAITASYHAGGQTEELTTGYDAMKALIALVGDEPYDSIFASRCTGTPMLDHDLVVPLSSQTGYISSTTRFAGTGHSIPASNTETSNELIQQKVATLLFSDDTTLFSRGFPAPSDFPLDCQTAIQGIDQPGTGKGNIITQGSHPFIPQVIPASGDPGNSSALGGLPIQYLHITSPMPGTVYQQNSHTSIRFSYEAIGGPVIAQATVFVQGSGWYPIPGNSAPFSITLPDDMPPGPLNLILLAKDTAGRLFGDTTSITITPQAPLDSLSVYPTVLFLDSVQRTGAFYVQGYYSGSHGAFAADLSASSTGTRYSLLHGTSIADVSSEGIVAGIQPGTDTLIIVNGGISRRVPVTVKDSIQKSYLYPNQIILSAIPDKKPTDPPFALQAFASSGEQVTFTIAGPATLDGKVLTLSSPGQVTVTGSQQGNAYFAVAPEVTLSFCVAPTDTPIIRMRDNQLISNIPAGNQWFLNGVLIPGATDSVYHPLTGGNYTVNVSVQGCQGPVSQPFNYTVTAVSGPTAPDNDLWVYPNPARDEMVVDYSNGHPYTICIYSMSGQTILAVTGIMGRYSLHMDPQAAGCYLLVITDERDHTKRRRLVMKK